MTTNKNTPTVVTFASKLYELEASIPEAFRSKDEAAILATQKRIIKAAEKIRKMRARFDESFDRYVDALGSDSLPNVTRIRRITDKSGKVAKAVEVDTSLDF